VGNLAWWPETGKKLAGVFCGGLLIVVLYLAGGPCGRGGHWRASTVVGRLLFMTFHGGKAICQSIWHDIKTNMVEKRGPDDPA